MKCMGCTKRHPGCHSTCEDYAEFKKEVDKARTQRRTAIYEPIYAYKMAGISKRIRREHQSREHGNLSY